MNKSLVTCARSPLGTLLALSLAVALLLSSGLFLVNDILPGRSGAATLALAATRGGANAPGTLQQFADSLKIYRDPELVSAYGVMILLLGSTVGIVGGFIRRYRFRFLPEKRVIERQALWGFVPAWFGLWGLMFLAVMLSDRGLVYWLLPGLVDAKRVGPMGNWLFVPVWLTVSAAISIPAYLLLIHLPLWFFLRRVLTWSIYIPSWWRTRISFMRVKRLEIQSNGEGARVLTLTLDGERAWTIRRGRHKRLTRTGTVLSRILHMERRDYVTWS